MVPSDFVWRTYKQGWSKMSVVGSIDHFTVHQQARRCGGYNPFNDYYIRKAVTEISVTAFFKN